MRESYDTPNNFFNRELSWLEFNSRVLEQANNIDNPLLERLRFLSIVSSNLDEFFMVRVASIYDRCAAGLDKLDISGRNPRQQMNDVLKKSRNMVKNQYKSYNILQNELLNHGIKLLKYDELSESYKEFIDDYYKNEIYPVLTPMVIDSARPFPLVLDKTLNIAMLLKNKIGSQKLFATIQVPSVLNRFVALPYDNNLKYILLEDIISSKLNELFSSHEVVSNFCYRITKNASMNVDEEEAEDLLETIEESLKQRRWGENIRLEIQHGASDEIIDILTDELEITSDYVFPVDGPIDLTFLSKIASVKGFDELKFDKIKQNRIYELENTSLFDVVRKKDILLHHPYQSFEPVINLIKEATEDPNVLAIKQTLYRVSGNSPIIEYLKKAAERGKQVTVLVELKARFDEENNINWARQLEQAGCHVIYGIVGLKTHCKVLLIVRKEKDGIKRYMHFGTGNYNDVTANFYTDLGIITCDKKLGEDASTLFNMLSGYCEPKNMDKLTIAPINLREKFENMIDREIENAKSGKKAKIIAKMNSLYDKRIILKLYEASNAGVRINLIVRGVCSLKPNIKGLSENINVISIVGRYLEHSRIFYFYNDGKEDIYISSADWMYRNLSNRVETMVTLDDKNIKNKIKEILELQLSDTTNASKLNSDGSYSKVCNLDKKINSQLRLSQLMKDKKNNFKIKAIFTPIMS